MLYNQFMQSFEWKTAPLNRNTLLEASAGTGKTYTLERIVLRMITEREVPVQALLVVTFTNPAARELQERIRELLSLELKDARGRKRELLRQAVMDFDKAAIYTIHGFCSRILQNRPFESGVAPGLEIGEEDDLADRALRDSFLINKRESLPSHLKAGYDGAYKKRGGFEGIISRLKGLLASDLLSGDSLILPDVERESLLKDIYGAWENQRGLLKLLAARTRQIDSKELQAQLKANGLGEGLGPKKAEALYDELCRIDRFEDLSSFLEYLAGPGKTLYNRLAKSFDQDDESENDRDGLFIDSVLRLRNILRDDWEGLSPGDLLLSGSILFELTCARDAKKQIDKERLDQGKLSFNDLIEVVHNVLAGPDKRPALIRALQNQYQVLMVDEFQDTDQRQWDIFSSIFSTPGHTYFLIGDPKQSIYRFRGADLQVYLKVRDALPPESRCLLDTNYRSHPCLVDVFNNLFPSLFGETGREGSIGYSPVGAGRTDAPRLREGDVPGAPAEFILLGGEEESPDTGEALILWLEATADHIASLLSRDDVRLDNKALCASDIAVLLEKNDHCSRLQNMLLQRSVPAVIFQEKDIYSTGELNIITLFLGALENRDRGESLRRLLLSSLVGISPGELLYLEEKGALDDLILKFRLYKDEVDRGDLIGPFHDFCDLGTEIARTLSGREETDEERCRFLAVPLMVRILSQKGGERTYTNIRHILELLHGEQQRRRYNGEELYNFARSESFRNHTADSYHVRLDRDGDAVQIMTLHKSKGLQFPLVFFGGGLYGELLKRKSSSLSFPKEGKRVNDFLFNDENKVKARREEWEEKKRLYYVALTRAESKLYLPLYRNWDKAWLSWLYMSFTGETGDIDPFQGSRLALEGGSSYKGICKLAEDNPTFYRIIPPRRDGATNSENGKAKVILTEPPRALLNIPGRTQSLISFSSLISRNHGSELHYEDSSEGADYDGEEEDMPSLEEETDTPRNIPGGAQLGNLVHSLFEELDYTLCRGTGEEFFSHGETDDFMKEKALYYFKADWYRRFGPVLKQMVWNTLRAPLGTGSLPDDLPASLSCLEETQRLHELEFLIALKNKGTVQLGTLQYSCSEGYLKGFIDLIFLWEGKYYIADWKTTRCAPGDREPYGEDSLSSIMDDHYYHLQYWIYTAAFYLYMKQQGTFSYEKEFGGVFYFFNRGMEEKEDGRGIYFTKPPEQELLAFMENFIPAQKGGCHD